MCIRVYVWVERKEGEEKIAYNKKDTNNTFFNNLPTSNGSSQLD